MCSLDNLRRAYRWIQSNPDAHYKSYFRDLYGAYAAASDHNLRRLRKNLLRRGYEPGHAGKIYLPKPSGVLRPITLLTVNDQIVYQACVNIIAERLEPKIRKRKNKQIFGHLYAGKSSKFFYLKWQNGYKSFSKEVESNITSGYNIVANFDLAAFYDSIDHHVIRHFLKELRIDIDLIDFLLSCLKTWTCNTWTSVSNYIYHEHGIPQGPLSSGMLSELILKYIDDIGCRRGSVKYIRYVDDIKLFATNETALRQRLISLDLAAKEVGLFPQSSKINIRKVTNFLEEIKSVSRPPEPSITPLINQNLLCKRLLEMTKGGSVSTNDVTMFKYLLSNAKPSHKLNSRLVKVLKRQQFFSPQIASYFSKYSKLPARASNDLLSFLLGDEIYHSVHADVLNAMLDNLPLGHRHTLSDFCHRRLFKPSKNLPRLQPTYKAALISGAIRHNRMTFAELSEAADNEIDWWVVKSIIVHLDTSRYGKPSFEAFLNEMVVRKNAEIARIAALKIIEEDLCVANPGKCYESAKLLLYTCGKIRRIGKPESLVEVVINYVLSHRFPRYDWSRLFGAKAKHAELIAFSVKKNFESDINACIVTFDSLADLVFEVLCSKFIPGTSYGSFGGMIHNRTMRNNLPLVHDGFKALHDLRLQSVTAHPRHRGSGGATRRLKHRDFYNIRPKLVAAFREIITNVIP